MKLLGLLNLRGISGQIAALVVRLDRRAASDHHRELSDPPARPAGSVDGPRHGQLAAAAQLLGAAPASERPRLSADIARAFPQLGIANLAAGRVPAAGEPDGPDLHGLQRRLGRDYRIVRAAAAGERRPQRDRHRACRTAR